MHAFTGSRRAGSFILSYVELYDEIVHDGVTVFNGLDEKRKNKKK